MEPNEPWVALVIALFGAGGLVSLVKAILDWKNGKATRESEAEVRYLLDRERRIKFLEDERDRDHRYIGDLIRALARANGRIPDRRND
jgi:hypothetical protein